MLSGLNSVAFQLKWIDEVSEPSLKPMFVDENNSSNTVIEIKTKEII